MSTPGFSIVYRWIDCTIFQVFLNMVETYVWYLCLVKLTLVLNYMCKYMVNIYNSNVMRVLMIYDEYVINRIYIWQLTSSSSSFSFPITEITYIHFMHVTYFISRISLNTKNLIDLLSKVINFLLFYVSLLIYAFQYQQFFITNYSLLLIISKSVYKLIANYFYFPN